MQNNSFFLIAPCLRLSPKRHSLKQPLHYQYRRHETTTLWAAGKRRGSKTSQRICRLSGGLERCRRSAPIPRALICPRDHSLQGDKLSPQWSSCRTFRHWKNKRVGHPEILLAKSEEGRWDLCQRIWHLSDFKKHPPQALWKLTVFAYTNSSMGRPFHRLCDWLTIVRRLEGRQL